MRILYCFGFVALLALVSWAGTQGDGSFTRDGTVLYYHTVGEQGSRVVLLAGGPGGDLGYVQPVIDELRKTHRCVVFEQRGTGRSTLPTYDFTTIHFEQYLKDLEALRVALGERQLLLVGHSWGGMLALSYAGTYPKHVRGVVSIDAGPIAEEHAMAEEANALRRLLPEERAAVERWEARAAAEPLQAFGEMQKLLVTAYYYDRKRATDSVHWMTPQLNLRVMWLGYQPQFGSLDTFIRARLHAIRAPVLLVHGRQDPVAEAGVAEAHHLIRGSQLVLVQKSGHLPWVEQPEPLWSAVNQFLDRFRK